MLSKITLDNFKSFKNKTTIDLAKTNYTILPQNVADNGVLKGCIFVGAIASGAVYRLRRLGYSEIISCQDSYFGSAFQGVFQFLKKHFYS